MKPRIWFSVGKWLVEYNYQARQFALFGADAEARERIRRQHIARKSFDTWSDACEHLREEYRSGNAWRHWRR